jgi:uncharacterized protein YecT (DUF1311 family)
VKKRELFYILSIIIGIGVSITMIMQSEKKINILEEQIDEYQNMQTEINSVSKVLQESLDEANERNRVLESQIKESDIRIEVMEQYYGDYQGNDDFSDIINNNPIDKDYRIEFDELQKNDNFTTLAMGAIEGKYTREWEDEVNAALKYLFKSLNEQDSINLKQAQNSWQMFMDDDYNFVSEKFIFTRYFGTQGKVQIETVRLQRTRERAIELMEYIFSMDRSAVDFVYDN